MPPTIIVTVGRLALELDPPPAAEPDEPDEQAATVSAVAHTAASPARDPFLRPILGMVLLLITFVGWGEDERRGRQRPAASLTACGRQASSRRSSRLISHSATSAITPMMTIPAKMPSASKLFCASAMITPS